MSRRPDLAVRAARMVVGSRERAGTLVVHDGVIVGVGRLDHAVDAVLELTLADDEVLLPGLVDTHVHVNEPGRTHWEGFASATRAAAAGGVTTIVDMPLNSLPPTLDRAALDLKRSAAHGKTWVDVAFWGGATEANLAEIDGLLAGGVLGVKGFLCDSGVPEFGSLTGTDLETAARVVAGHDALLLVHAETGCGSPSVPDHSYAGFLASRPADCEADAVREAVRVARDSGCRVHVVHVSSAEAVALLRAARADGVAITGETCPHYLTLDVSAIADGATEFKCCPPIRDRVHQAALWQGLADGTLAAVVSDHSPAPAELKERDSGDFVAAWGGISSLQLGLAVTWTAARERGVPLAELSSWMSAGPAALVGARTKGRLEVGRDADLCVFAPDDEQVVDGRTLEHRHPLTPYDGMRLRGVVRQTWLRGRPIDLDRAPTGRLHTRGEL